MSTVTEQTKRYRKSFKIKAANKRIRDHIDFIKKEVNGTIFTGGYDNGPDCAVTCNEGEIL